VSIELDRVTKYFGALCAVHEISFRVDSDEIVGFVGPNGAGKSTVLRMIATYLDPSSGTVRVAGYDTAEHPLEVRRRIGYLSGDTPLYPAMRVDRFLRFVGQARGLRGEHLARQTEWVVETTDIGPVMRQRVQECSTGFRQRIGLASALIHDPSILVLDEPTHGFDPVQVLAFRDTLAALRPGRAILFSSHIVHEVAALSDRMLLIHQGRLLADGRPDAIASEAGLSSSEMDRVFAHLVTTAPDPHRA